MPAGCRASGFGYASDRLQNDRKEIDGKNRRGDCHERLKVAVPSFCQMKCVGVCLKNRSRSLYILHKAFLKHAAVYADKNLIEI